MLARAILWLYGVLTLVALVLEQPVTLAVAP